MENSELRAMRIGATGHQSVPETAWVEIRAGISFTLSGIADLHGICCLAAGADQEFAELVHMRGGSLTAIIPCAGYENTFGEVQDLERYKRLLGIVDEAIRMPFLEPSERAFFEAGKKVVDMSERLLAVWDGDPSRGLGGTGDVVDYARRQDVPVEIVWPSNLAR